MTARKTLSIKKPYGTFWAAQPDVNNIESKLNQTVMQIMGEYNKSSNIYFNEQHRRIKNAMLDQKLQDCLRDSMAEIDKEKKTPQFKTSLFQQITARVKEKLNDEEARKFDAALNALSTPKPVLPIVKM